MITTRDPVNN